MRNSLRSLVALPPKETPDHLLTVVLTNVLAKRVLPRYISNSTLCSCELTSVVQTFIKSVLAKDSKANVILGGDLNEYSQTTSVFAALKGVLTEIDESSNIAPVERYTYVYGQNCQQLDHMFLSDNIVGKGTEVEHVHVNTWAAEYSKQVSDHDPSVARITIS